jgi:hypothetical protein
MRWFMLLVVLAWSTDASAFADDLPRKIKPVLVWTGTDSAQTKESFLRCCTQEDWEEKWRLHRGKVDAKWLPDCPEVDFGAYMMVIFFEGESAMNYGIRIAEVVEERNCLRLRYQPISFQTIFPAGTKVDWKKLETKSYAFVVLPKSAKSIILEKDLQPLLGKPPVWKEHRKIPGVEEK